MADNKKEDKGSIGFEIETSSLSAPEEEPQKVEKKEEKKEE